MIDDLEIATYEEAVSVQAYLSPDGLKVLIVNFDRKRMQIVFLHEKEKIEDRIKTIPIEEGYSSVCWFSDSE